MRKILFLLMALFLFHCPASRAQGKGVVCYYAGFQEANYPVSRIDWTACTELDLAFYTNVVVSQVTVSGGTTTYTVTSGAGNVTAGNQIAIAGFTNSGNNGLFTVATATGTTTGSFTVTTSTQVNETKNAVGMSDQYGFDAICSSFTTPGHAAGAKVIPSFGGASDTTFASALSTSISGVETNIATIVSNCSFDGANIDWENSVVQATFVTFASDLRTAHSTWNLSAFIDGTNQPNSLPAAIVGSLTHVDAGTYGFGFTGTGWESWYHGPIYGYNGAPQTYTSADGIVQAWHTAGTPYSKIAIGEGFYGNLWHGVTAPLQSSVSATVNFEVPYGWNKAGGGLLACYYNQSTGQYFFDPSPALSSQAAFSPKLPYQPSIEYSTPVTLTAPCPSGPGNTSVGWVTYEDEASIAQKGSYVNSNSLYGTIIWTLNEGAFDATTGRNPLLDATKRYYNNGSPAPLTQLGFSRGEVCPTPLTLDCSGGSVVNINITGLSGLGLVDVSLNNDTSGTAADTASDPGFGTNGHPSHYAINCSTNGGSSYSLCSNCEPACNAFATTTADTFSVRQFAVDLTGTGVNAIQLHITATDSAANQNGFVGLSVQGASGTFDLNDTFMLFGDSLTSNCWGANFNGPAATGGVEVLGSLIHAAKPAHYPISSYFGQSGWKTSDALLTTTYSPLTNFQQFLTQCAACKYVGISMGTNDANGGIAPATYCANMQTLAQEAIALGKTPIIPTLINSPAFAGGANDASHYNSCIATLIQNEPSILSGPDLFTIFSGHSQADGWFFDNLHPAVNTGYVTGGNCNSTTVNATPCGCVKLQQAWASNIEANIYPLATANSTPPAPATGMFADLKFTGK